MQNLVALLEPKWALWGAMPPPEHPESLQSIAKRLRALRGALKISQDKLALTVGAASKSATWSPYETGKDRISLDNALALCRLYGVTLDWIYRGQWHAGIPFDLAERIRFEELKEDQSRPKKSS